MMKNLAVILSVVVILGAHHVAARQTGIPVRLTNNQKTAWQGVYTVDQATRGGESYRQFCSRCHGESLRGGATSAGSPALTGKPFINRWNGLSVFDLAFAIQNSMPHQEGVFIPGGTVTFLPANTVRDIVSYIIQANGMPAGTGELPVNIDALRNIIITSGPTP